MIIRKWLDYEMLKQVQHDFTNNLLGSIKSNVLRLVL